MNLIQAFVTKDQMIKQALYDTFSDDEATIERIDQAFESGNRNWARHLRNIFGLGEVEAFFSLFRKDITNVVESSERAYMR